MKKIYFLWFYLYFNSKIFKLFDELWFFLNSTKFQEFWEFEVFLELMYFRILEFGSGIVKKSVICRVLGIPVILGLKEFEKFWNFIIFKYSENFWSFKNFWVFFWHWRYFRNLREENSVFIGIKSVNGIVEILLQLEEFLKFKNF